MQFKKYINMFLALLLLVSNTGLALNVHYCGGKVASVGLQQTKTACCGQKKDSKKDKCCKDKKIVVEKKSDDILIKSYSLQLDSFIVVPTYERNIVWSTPVFNNNLAYCYTCDANAPPLFKLYCQYLFYDRV